MENVIYVLVAFVWVVGIFVLTAISHITRLSASIRRDVARLDRKLDLLMKQVGVSYEESFGFSERVKEIARDPNRKIEAIKAYREETGADLADAKQAVEA